MKKKEVTKTAPMIVVTNEEGEALPHNQNFACRDLLGQGLLNLDGRKKNTFIN